MRPWWAVLAGAAAVGLAGCGHALYLRPAPSATLVKRNPPTAAATEQGVTLEASPDLWSGNPPALARIMDPVQIAILNRSGRALRFRYLDFALVSDTGFETNPLPPFRTVRPTEAVPLTTSAEFARSDFFVAPSYGRFYAPPLPAWSGPFDTAPGYNHMYFMSWLHPLPTPEMMKQAIPEGVIADGGSVSGYLYFHRLLGKTAGATFTFDLADGNTQQTFGEIALPLVLK